MYARYSSRKRRQPGFGFSVGRAFGPSRPSASAAAAAERPWSGSTPSLAATSFPSSAYQRSTTAAASGSVTSVTSTPSRRRWPSRPARARAPTPAPAPARWPAQPRARARARACACPCLLGRRGLRFALLLLLERIGRRALRCRFHERFLDLGQVGARLVAHDRIARIELDQRVCDHRPGGDAGEPLVVGRDHVPRRPLGARVREHLRERLLVVVPVLALGDVVRRELPVLLREVEPLQEPRPLLLLREVEEELDDPEAVVARGSAPSR